MTIFCNITQNLSIYAQFFRNLHIIYILCTMKTFFSKYVLYKINVVCIVHKILRLYFIKPLKQLLDVLQILKNIVLQSNNKHFEVNSKHFRFLYNDWRALAHWRKDINFENNYNGELQISILKKKSVVVTFSLMFPCHILCIIMNILSIIMNLKQKNEQQTTLNLINNNQIDNFHTQCEIRYIKNLTYYVELVQKNL